MSTLSTMLVIDADIPLLAKAILERTMSYLQKQVDGCTDEALNCMGDYDWPGNIRELENEVQRMLVLGQGNRLGAELLSPAVRHLALCHTKPTTKPAAEQEHLAELKGTLRDQVAVLESRILQDTLIRLRWNKTCAAEELGLSRVGLRSKLECYGLESKLNS